MPFVKRDSGTAKPAAADIDIAALTATLRSSDPEARWRAARNLGGRAEAVPQLAAALDGETVPRVFEALITGLMRVGGDASVAALLPYIRSADAARRSAVIEALQALPNAIAPFMTALLSDGDTDVRILVVELARGMPAPEATSLLCELLDNEQHPNVCGAAVDVLAEVGTREALPVLRACADRFAAVPFLPFAISTVIARIADAEG